MTRNFRPALLAVLAMLATYLIPTPARADFRVCNATQTLVGVAIGYRGEKGWKSEGWWNIEASTCQTLLNGALSSRFYYLYAEDGDRGGVWEGPISMCIADKPFNIDGVNDCFQRGFQKKGFREYDTGGQASWMVQLTDEPGAPPSTPAPEAPAAPEPDADGPDGAGNPDDPGGDEPAQDPENSTPGAGDQPDAPAGGAEGDSQ